MSKRLSTEAIFHLINNYKCRCMIGNEHFADDARVELFLLKARIAELERADPQMLCRECMEVKGAKYDATIDREQEMFETARMIYSGGRIVCEYFDGEPRKRPISIEESFISADNILAERDRRRGGK